MTLIYCSENKPKCQFEGCNKKAVGIACGKFEEHKEPAFYCEEHSDLVADEKDPEYTKHCPNCGCNFGIG